MKSRLWGLLALGWIPWAAAAQPTWQGTSAAVPPPVLFRAVTFPDYPTVETLGRGDFHYEISHRFHPPIDAGRRAGFGLDGPASIRMALAYGITDRLMLTLGRSSLLDNLDLQGKWRLWDRTGSPMPAAMAVNLGGAWSTDMPALVRRDGADAKNLQAYAQLVLNARAWRERLGLGVVPSYVYNSAIFAVGRQHTLAMGLYAEYRLNQALALWSEYGSALAGYQGILLPGESGRSHASLALGVDLDTGGHHFYLFATNNTRLNPALHLVGAPDRIAPDRMRLAFCITRYL